MSYYQHNYEGDDDMPAYIKATLIGSSVSIPISNGHIYVTRSYKVCEHRDQGGARSIIAAIQA